MADGHFGASPPKVDLRPDPQRPNGGAHRRTELAVGEVYIQLRLHSMRIPLSKASASSSASFTLSRASTIGRAASRGFHVVTSPSKLEAIDRSHMDHVVMGKKLLLGPVVYRGGLEVDVGLFSVVAANLALPYLTLLQTLSDTAGVAFVGAAAPIVTSIKAGVGLLAKQPGQAALGVGTRSNRGPQGGLLPAPSSAGRPRPEPHTDRRGRAPGDRTTGSIGLRCVHRPLDRVLVSQGRLVPNPRDPRGVRERADCTRQALRAPRSRSISTPSRSRAS